MFVRWHTDHSPSAHPPINMRTILVLLSCIMTFVSCLDTEAEVKVGAAREPRLFWVSTSQTTTTLTTVTVCFSTSDAAAVACKKKRKRSILDEASPGAAEVGEYIRPQKTGFEEDEDTSLDLESGAEKSHREGRFFLYWITTTSTSTTTTFSATSTIQSIVCTPNNFYSACA